MFSTPASRCAAPRKYASNATTLCDSGIPNMRGNASRGKEPALPISCTASLRLRRQPTLRRSAYLVHRQPLSCATGYPLRRHSRLSSAPP